MDIQIYGRILENMACLEDCMNAGMGLSYYTASGVYYNASDPVYSFGNSDAPNYSADEEERVFYRIKQPEKRHVDNHSNRIYKTDSDDEQEIRDFRKFNRMRDAYHNGR